jgi:hypothetical protein
MKAHRRKAVIDVRDARLLLREFQVQLGGEKLLDLLFGGADFSNSGIAHDGTVISKTY